MNTPSPREFKLRYIDNQPDQSEGGADELVLPGFETLAETPSEQPADDSEQSELAIDESVSLEGARQKLGFDREEVQARPEEPSQPTDTEPAAERTPMPEWFTGLRAMTQRYQEGDHASTLKELRRDRRAFKRYAEQANLGDPDTKKWVDYLEKATAPQNHRLDDKVRGALERAKQAHDKGKFQLSRVSRAFREDYAAFASQARDDNPDMSKKDIQDKYFEQVDRDLKLDKSIRHSEASKQAAKASEAGQAEPTGESGKPAGSDEATEADSKAKAEKKPKTAGADSTEDEAATPNRKRPQVDKTAQATPGSRRPVKTEGNSYARNQEQSFKHAEKTDRELAEAKKAVESVETAYSPSHVPTYAELMGDHAKVYSARQAIANAAALPTVKAAETKGWADRQAAANNRVELPSWRFDDDTAKRYEKYAAVLENGDFDESKLDDADQAKFQDVLNDLSIRYDDVDDESARRRYLQDYVEKRLALNEALAASGIAAKPVETKPGVHDHDDDATAADGKFDAKPGNDKLPDGIQYDSNGDAIVMAQQYSNGSWHYYTMDKNDKRQSLKKKDIEAYFDEHGNIEDGVRSASKLHRLRGKLGELAARRHKTDKDQQSSDDNETKQHESLRDKWRRKVAGRKAGALAMAGLAAAWKAIDADYRTKDNQDTKPAEDEQVQPKPRPEEDNESADGKGRERRENGRRRRGARALGAAAVAATLVALGAIGASIYDHENNHEGNNPNASGPEKPGQGKNNSGQNRHNDGGAQADKNRRERTGQQPKMSGRYHNYGGRQADKNQSERQAMSKGEPSETKKVETVKFGSDAIKLRLVDTDRDGQPDRMTATLKSHDGIHGNPWNAMKQELDILDGKNNQPTVGEIDQAKDKLLNETWLTEQNSYDLPVGTKIHSNVNQQGDLGNFKVTKPTK